MTDEWLPVCEFGAIRDGGCREFAYLENGEIRYGFLVRKGPSVYAYANSCPHLKIALNWMEDHFLDFGQEHIQCALHGALFEISSGLCISGPCFGRHLEAIPLANHDGSLTMPMSVRFESAVRWGAKLPDNC